MTLRQPALPQLLAPFALALLLLARPYEGIDRDDVLYLGQVLQATSAPQLSADLFFAGGSQNDYSLYARLLGPLYATAGVAATHLGLLIACWLASLAGLLRWQARLGIDDPRARWLGLACLAVASPFYGGLRKFGLLEPFLTARTLAEPLLIASLALLATERLRAALALQVAAAAVHPLMALPALLLTWLLASWRDRRWWALALAAPLLLALAGLGLAPARLVERYDEAWWQLVATSNAQVLLSQWTLADWTTAATDAVVVALAALMLPAASGRRMLLALLAATGLLLAVNLIGTDGLHAVFITQLQPWRGLWLLHLASLLLTPWLLWQTARQGGLWRWSAASLALAQLSSHTGSPYGLPLLAIWALCHLGARRGATATPALARLAVTAAALGAVALCAADALARLQRLHWYPTVSVALDSFSRLATEPLITAAGTGLLLWVAHRHAAGRWAAGLLGLALLGFAASHWDRRDALARAVETPPAEHAFADAIPLGASVYWPEHLAVVWGLLQRTSHFDAQQGAGLLFNRATAERFAQRQAVYADLTEAREQCRTGVALSRGSAADLAACDTPTAARIATLCQAAQRPDFLVFAQPLGPPPLRRWAIGDDAYHLYACTQFAPAAR